MILDSGFCVLKAIIELKNKGVYASAVVKKRRYWPKYVKGGDVKKYFEDKPVGTSDALGGTLDGVPFHLFCMKEENCVQTLMSTYGTMEEKSTANRTLGKKTGEERPVSFPLPEVHYNHFKGRHSVDDNNRQQMQPISLEETWKTWTWENRTFDFLLGVSAANSQYTYHFFGIIHRKLCYSTFRFLHMILSKTYGCLAMPKN